MQIPLGVPRSPNCDDTLKGVRLLLDCHLRRFIRQNSYMRSPRLGQAGALEHSMGVALARGIGAGYQQDCQEVKDEHQGEEGFRAGIGAGEFFPDEDAPQGCDHGSGLTDGVGDSDAGVVGGDEIEDGAGGPYGAA